MPYIITTRQTGVAEPGERFQRGTRPRAVATLWETDVRTALKAMGLTIAQRETVIHDVVSLPESGGAITLPDETVIEVELATYDDLIAATPGVDWHPIVNSPARERRPKIIAAYNEVQT